MIKENIEAIVSRLENLITTKTIVGDPITSGNITIIPIISASFGFGTGSGEGTDPSRGGGKGGGGGAGARINPTALIIIQEGEVRVYSLAQKGTLEKLAELVPEALSRFGIDKPKTDCCK
ncbi:GerW family sporulation protein [Desulfotomaculum copahuensis]|uniref:Sporulation protein n=1 Tax=Desulfotomaculum copahuensis TaxID=1838280 RepID=A0A1B7LGJ3_9FIRM|nr:spore germination protein GerW family protein [Desulfotomaculum copahuensis]OAT85222.1 sporulation protein [Desulfotomaculum copahuensis]